MTPLRQYMTRHGVSGYRLSQVSGVSESIITRYNSEQRDMRLSTAFKIQTGMKELTGEFFALDLLFRK